MNQSFKPAGRATLMGSQPLDNHAEATRLALNYTPDIPAWVSLPVFEHEDMVRQFAAGLPGLVQQQGRFYVNHAADDFDNQLVSFFEEFLAVSEQEEQWSSSRFVLDKYNATGFFSLIEELSSSRLKPFAIKGQITGPFTFCTALKDQDGRPVFYHDALKDAAIKMIAMKAAWQVKQLSRFDVPVIIFLDEPALAGFGSSEFISISREDIQACLQEVIESIHRQGALAGLHVCANTDWSLLLKSELDIINFDAFAYFDKLILYDEELKDFFNSGGVLAWGIVPTLKPEVIDALTLDILWRDWKIKTEKLSSLGISMDTIRDQAIITPSCGCGPLTPARSKKVLELTGALAEKIRAS
ncbi:MAG: hypothetical protein GY874_03355 [Desulfobacteraceae bacterium]|nr:hypothetical protein [Desulfobacteraceae bacterium]